MSEKVEASSTGYDEHHGITMTHHTHDFLENEKTEVYDHTSDLAASLDGRPPSMHDGTKRGLSARHIQMISLGGAIGTGLFLTIGTSIADAGPAGALIAYLIIGSSVYCFMSCMGEMVSLLPVAGAFNHFAARFCDPALGFALGWNYWFSSVTIAAELAAAATIIRWWAYVMPDAAWAAIFLVIIVAVNCVGVRIYGEVEYWMCVLKIAIVLVFLIVSILVTSGAVGNEGVIGFKYWHDPGAFNGGAAGTISVLINAGFSFQGTEIVGITAGEAQNPSKTLPRAIRNVFWRIVLFYIFTIFMLGLCVAYNDPDLNNATGDATTAAFTLVFQQAGIAAGADVVNVVILTSVVSAANSDLYTCSRTLLGLSRDGLAPKVFMKTNRFGAPYVGVLVSSIVGFACVFVSIYSAEVAFGWFLSIAAITDFISWWGITFVFLRFRRAYVKQGRSVDKLPYKSWGYPFVPLYANVICLFVLFGQGYTAFTPTFDVKLFFENYIGLAPFFILLIGYKLIKKSKWVPMHECDFDTGCVSLREMEMEDDEEANKPMWKKVLHFIT
ncbi:amino acid permease/ SLC12A domain-containing protein [Gongronella butleri]|nr:amino acid permease/ SLC12A domain-containing protein [Gongronella butleri]